MAKWDDTIARMIKHEIFPTVIHRILLFGISRAGKSTLGEKLFPGNCERVPCHRDMVTDDLIGGLSLVNGSTQWLDGAALRALRQGKLVVFDEIDQRSPECTSYFHALLDDPPAVTLPTGERIQGAKGYCVIATTNCLPSELPLPIYDRFDAVFKVTELSTGLVKSLGDMATPAKNSASREAKKYASWTRPATINMWIAAAKLRAKGMTDERIAENLGLYEQDRTDFLTAIAPRS